MGARTIVAGVFTDNPASARVFEKIGFRLVGTMENCLQAQASKGGEWKSVLCLERKFADGKAET